MKNSIYPCLWFDGKAQEAAEFYCTLFDNSSIKKTMSMVTTFELDGTLFMGLNGGPAFQPNPSISFYATIEDEAKLRKIWDALTTGGHVMMPLDKYDWSPLYGWVGDKYGINWQLSLGKPAEVGQSIVPLLMFCGDHQNQAEAAVEFYRSVFSNSSTDFVARYAPGQTQTEATIVHSRFRLNDNVFMAMDSAVKQPFTFNEGISLVISCDTQEEIDHYWNSFTEKGEESMCGWCKDQFGVSWQITPSIIGSIMADPVKFPAAFEVVMKSRKLNIAELVSAAENA